MYDDGTMNPDTAQQFKAILKEELEPIIVQIEALQEDIVGLRSDSRTMKSDVGSLKSDVGSLKSDVGSLKSDVGLLKSDVGSLKSDVGSLSSEVGSLKEDMASVKDVLDQHTGTLIEIQNTLQAYSDMYTINRDDIKQLDTRVTHIEKHLKISPRND